MRYIDRLFDSGSGRTGSLSYSKHAEYLLSIQMSTCAFSLLYQNCSSSVYHHQPIGTIGGSQTSPKGTAQLVCGFSFPRKGRLSPASSPQVTPLSPSLPPSRGPGPHPRAQETPMTPARRHASSWGLTPGSRAHAPGEKQEGVDARHAQNPQPRRGLAVITCLYEVFSV